MASSSILLSAPAGPFIGTVHLPASKSIANRYLILQAHTDGKLALENMSNSDDSQILQSLLTQPPLDNIYDAHHAGTTSRFLLAYLALKDGTQILTGSERLKSRPIQPLAQALIDLGCKLEYLETEGSLPIKIYPAPVQLNSHVTLPGTVSSQFITALLLNGHSLPQGLKVNISGEWISRPYIDMTLAILKSVGIDSVVTEDSIYIANQQIIPTTISIESDWSAASYFLGLCALRPGSNLTLPHLFEDSIQGDSAMVKTLQQYGVEHTFRDGALHIVNKKTDDLAYPELLEMDLEHTPDIFQTYATIHAILGIKALYSGLSTLPHKETDRIAAMKSELAKLGSLIYKLPIKFSGRSGTEYFMQEEQATWRADVSFETYQDHRMAMSLALASVLGSVQIEDYKVVSKSFPHYWEELGKLGFEIS